MTVYGEHRWSVVIKWSGKSLSPITCFHSLFATQGHCYYREYNLEFGKLLFATLKSEDNPFTIPTGGNCAVCSIFQRDLALESETLDLILDMYLLLAA